MYTIIVGVSLLVLGILFLIIHGIINKRCKYYDSEDMFLFTGAISLIISVFILGFCGMMSVDIEKDWQKTILYYNTLNEMVDAYKEGKVEWSNNSNVYNLNLYRDVLEMNKTIDKHKTYHDSKWVGIWYSEEIGNLEHIKF